MNEPTRIYRMQDHPIPGPLAHPVAPPVVVHAPPEGVVWVPHAYGPDMVPVARQDRPPMPERTPPRDLAPAPLIHPRAQILAGGGVGVGAAGWGIGQAINAAAAFGSSGVMVVALLILAAKATAGRGHGGETHIHVTNHNKWFGKSTTNL
jgi:hypothetical protein